MATITWAGTTNNDWATGSNWSGGAEPANDDTVIIDGAVSIAGIDKSAVHLDYLFIRPTYTGQFGTSAATPVKVAVDNACVIQGGSQSGGVFLNSGGSNPIVSLTVNMPTPQHIFDIGGTVTYGLFRRGTIFTSAVFTNLTQDPLDGNSLNLPDTKFNGGSAVTWDNVGANASINAATTFTTANIISSVVWNNAGTLTTVNVIGRGAEFKHYHTATITTIECKYGGYLNASVDGRAKTITNVIRHPSARVNLNNGGGTITVTNGVKSPARYTDSEYGDPGAFFP